MTPNGKIQRIPEVVLDEQWFGFVHNLIEQMQATFRNSAKEQKFIAARLGKAPSVISRCLSGQQNMTIRTIHDLARAMDCRLEVAFRPLKDLAPSNYQPSACDQTQPAAATVSSTVMGGSKNSGANTAAVYIQ
jgi:hypothetical protein